MDSPKPPFHFLHGIDDERIRHLIVSVWRRLPIHDQAVLEESVSSVGFYPGLDEDHVLASVTPGEPDSAIDGIAAQIAEELYPVVNLDGARQIRSDKSCMFVIAHEFAHVVLRHYQINTVVGLLAPLGEPYRDAEIAHLKQWHEDEADLLVWVWGFQEELEAFREEFPESRCPRWYVEFEWEPSESTGAADRPTGQASAPDCDDANCES
jgi:hypothetical protein